MGDYNEFSFAVDEVVDGLFMRIDSNRLYVEFHFPTKHGKRKIIPISNANTNKNSGLVFVDPALNRRPALFSTPLTILVLVRYPGLPNSRLWPIVNGVAGIGIQIAFEVSWSPPNERLALCGKLPEIGHVAPIHRRQELES